MLKNQCGFKVTHLLGKMPLAKASEVEPQHLISRCVRESAYVHNTVTRSHRRKHRDDVTTITHHHNTDLFCETVNYRNCLPSYYDNFFNVHNFDPRLRPRQRALSLFFFYSFFQVLCGPIA